MWTKTLTTLNAGHTIFAWALDSPSVSSLVVTSTTWYASSQEGGTYGLVPRPTKTTNEAKDNQHNFCGSLVILPLVLILDSPWWCGLIRREVLAALHSVLWFLTVRAILHMKIAFLTLFFVFQACWSQLPLPLFGSSKFTFQFEYQFLLYLQVFRDAQYMNNGKVYTNILHCINNKGRVLLLQLQNKPNINKSFSIAI